MRIRLTPRWTKILRFIKDTIKRSIALALYSSGILWWLVHRRLKGKAVVLMYHRVLPQDDVNLSFSHPGMIVTPESFERHLDLLQHRFRPLSLVEFANHMENRRPFPKGACLITFDDGWVDNYEYALPLLRRRQIPAVVFVATGFIGSDRTFWQEHLSQLLYEATLRRVGQELLDAHGIALNRTAHAKDLRASIADVVDRYRSMTDEDTQCLISGLAEALNASGNADALSPRDKFMDWAQLKELTMHGIDVASHTCSHKMLIQLDSLSLRQELTDSMCQIETNLYNSVATLAYPSGIFDDRVRAFAQDCGYRVAFTTEKSLASPYSDPLLIPRINMHEAATSTTPLFICHAMRLL